MLIKKKVLVRRALNPTDKPWTVDRLIGILMHRGQRGFTWRELSREYKIPPSNLTFHSGLCQMYEKLIKTKNIRSEYQGLKGDSSAAQELRYFYVPTPPAQGTTKGSP